VVIAPEFDGDYDRERIDRLWALTRRVDSRLEPVPCGVREWGMASRRVILDIAERDGETIAA